MQPYNAPSLLSMPAVSHKYGIIILLHDLLYLLFESCRVLYLTVTLRHME